jgi:hypothetical protein
LAPNGYIVTITDVNNCGPVTSPTLTVSDATDISIIEGGLLKIYPNPAVDFLHIEYDGTRQATFTIALFTTTGQLVFIEKVPAATLRSGNYSIDVNHIARGMYILKLDDKIITEKIIVQ